MKTLIAEVVETYLADGVDGSEPRMKLLELHAALMNLYLVHWHNHWNSSGSNAYGNHLLHQRLYESLVEEIDTISEKITSTYGSGTLDVGLTTSLMDKFWARDSLSAEESLQSIIKTTYDVVKASGMMSLGMDDFLMSLASAHETNLYLLRQAYGHVKTSSDAKDFFFDNPKWVETCEFAESKSMTNDYMVAKNIVKYTDVDPHEIKREVNRTPPTVNEILEEPGSEELSTLSRLVVSTSRTARRRR